MNFLDIVSTYYFTAITSLAIEKQRLASISILITKKYPKIVLSIHYVLFFNAWNNCAIIKNKRNEYYLIHLITPHV